MTSRALHDLHEHYRALSDVFSYAGSSLHAASSPALRVCGRPWARRRTPGRGGRLQLGLRADGSDLRGQLLRLQLRHRHLRARPG